MASKRLTAEEWANYTTEAKERYFYKANRRHRWVMSLATQNIELKARVKELERILYPPATHTFFIKDDVRTCGRCGKGPTDEVHEQWS